MSWSLGEIEALTIKAARGAGHPWGVADEAGWAVRWLAARGLPGPEAMATLLDAAPADRSPLSIGIAMADACDLALVNGQVVHQPLIIVPFLGRLAGPGSLIKARADGEIFHVSRDETDLTETLSMTAILEIQNVPGQLPSSIPKHRVEDLANQARETLDRLAKRTYAPATEQSRTSGAGAGLTDND